MADGLHEACRGYPCGVLLAFGTGRARGCGRGANCAGRGAGDGVPYDSTTRHRRCSRKQQKTQLPFLN